MKAAAARERKLDPATLWTVEEVATYLKVPTSWVYERTRAGRNYDCACRQCACAARRAHHLSAASGSEFDVVNGKTDRNCF